MSTAIKIIPLKHRTNFPTFGIFISLNFYSEVYVFYNVNVSKYNIIDLKPWNGKRTNITTVEHRSALGWRNQNENDGTLQPGAMVAQQSVAYLNNSNEIRGMNRANWQRSSGIQRRTIVDETVTNSDTVETWKPDGRRRIDKRPNARVDRCVRRDSNYLCWSLSMQMPYLHSITARHASISARPANHGIFLLDFFLPSSIFPSLLFSRVVIRLFWTKQFVYGINSSGV